MTNAIGKDATDDLPLITHWHQRWANRQTGWDLNGPHPLTSEIIRLVGKINPQTLHGKWLIPGCGRAHDALPLLAAGASHVSGRDLVPLAIDEARACYGQTPNLSLQCRNMLEIDPSEDGSIDAVFDRAMLCALPGDERAGYVESVTRLCHSGGIFASIPFAQTASPETGPPFQISESQLRQLFEPCWEILHLEERTDGFCDDRILKEWLFIARKR